MKTKIILAAIFAALFGAFFYFDLQQYISLQSLKEQKDALQQLYLTSPVTISAAYFVVYVMVAALALPAAAIITLAGGAIFGFWHGLILVSFASSIGATIAFVLTRFLFHDTVQNKFGNQLEAVNKGIENEGAFYVFGMRLVPLFPFVVVNSLLALTKLKATTFYWASQLGMLVGTAVFVNAGTQLAEIESLGDILSLNLILSFILLGVFPIIAKHALSWLKKNKQTENNYE